MDPLIVVLLTYLFIVGGRALMYVAFLSGGKIYAGIMGGKVKAGAAHLTAHKC